MIKELQIGAHTYTVQQKNIGSLNKGTCNVSSKTILIDIDAKRIVKAEALLHEALHAIMSEYGLVFGLSENEEEFRVRVLEAGILALFVYNKQFTKELLTDILKQ